MRPPPVEPELRRWTMSDGYVISGRFWPPRRRHPRRPIIYLHGIQSHGGWFAHSASLLAEAGEGVLLPDRRGSGLNEVARGDVPRAERWLADLDELADWLARQYGTPRCDVVGVSWGGKLAAAWGVQRPERVVRLLLIAPGLYPAVDVGLRGRLAIGRALLTAGGGRQFDIPLQDPALFTDNPDGQRFIRRDRLKLTQATARFFWYSRRLDRMVLRGPGGHLRAETTLVLAEEDRIIRNQPTIGWARRATGGTVRIISLPGAHTLEFAEDPEQFWQVVRNWASQRRNLPAAGET